MAEGIILTSQIEGGRHLKLDQFHSSQGQFDLSLDQSDMYRSFCTKIFPKICESRAEFVYLTISAGERINNGSLWLPINHAAIMHQ